MLGILRTVTQDVVRVVGGDTDMVTVVVPVDLGAESVRERVKQRATHAHTHTRAHTHTHNLTCFTAISILRISSWFSQS